MAMVAYNRELFVAAHQRFMHEAKSLTDEDLEQFRVVDPDLAERARAKKFGFIEPESDDERKMFAQPLRYRDLWEHQTEFLDPLLATYRFRLKESRELIGALEQRIAALERKPSLKFAGVYERGGAYSPGDAVVDKSALWVCTVPTTTRPGEDHSAWKLALKRWDTR